MCKEAIDNKQLLDEVFVICRIINVEVRVISRAEGEADITICKQPFGANFFTRCCYAPNVHV